MRSAMIAMIVVSTLIGSVGAQAVAVEQDEGTTTELQKFQGTWSMISAKMNGNPVEDAHVQQSRITFVGDKVELIAPHQHKETILASITKLDATKNPKEMQWVRATGPNAGITMIAIYEFEGPDQYKICFDPTGEKAPTGFDAEAGTGQIWQTWKRVKP